MLVAEIQQNSDTTYRLYDYNRPGLDGQPRELHIEDSLNVIAYDGAGSTYMKTDLPTPTSGWLLRNLLILSWKKGKSTDTGV